MRKKFLQTIVTLWVVLIGLYSCASHQYYEKGLNYLETEQWDKAIESFKQAELENPKDLKIQIALERAEHKQAAAWAESGRKALQQNKLKLAENYFKNALNIDPLNALAQDGIRYIYNLKEARRLSSLAQLEEKEKNFEKAIAYYQEALALVPDFSIAIEGLERVNSLYKRSFGSQREMWNQIVSFNFHDARLIDILKALAAVSEINVLFDDVDVLQSRVSVDLNDIKIKDALNNIIKTYNLFLVELGADTFLITADNKENRKKYYKEEVKIFNLNYADAAEIKPVLASILPSVTIIADERLNEILVSTSPENMKTISQLISALDTRESEVVIDVEVLEVTKNMMKNLGTSLGDSPQISLKIGGGVKKSGSNNSLSISDVQNLNQGQIYLKIPSVYLDLLKRDSQTRVLAKPNLRILNRTSAKLHIGEKIPIKVTTSRYRDTSEETSIYEYKDVGIVMELTPKIINAIEMSLDLHIEISSIIGGINPEQPTIGTREIQTTLRLRDGETAIIGGLIKNDERENITKIPLLGDIPAIGRIFSSLNQQSVQTDIIISLTPYLMDKRNFTACSQTFYLDDFSQVKQKNKSMQHSIESKKEKLGGDISKKQNTQTFHHQQGNKNTQQFESDSNVVKVFLEPSNFSMHVNDVRQVSVWIDGAENVGSVPFYLEFNPKCISIENVIEGDFLSQGNQATAFLSSIDNEKGRVIIGLTRLSNSTGAKGSGVLLKFDVRAKFTGKSEITFTHASVRDPLAGILRAEFSNGEIIIE